MNDHKKQSLFPQIRIVTLNNRSDFQAPYCSIDSNKLLKDYKYLFCTCDKDYPPLNICSCDYRMCTCDTVLVPRYPKYCNCDCVHCRCDCDHCKCDCDHCKCDCDFCSCVTKGGLSPEEYHIQEGCETHSRTFFKLSNRK